MKALVIKYLGVTVWKIIEAAVYGMALSALITSIIFSCNIL